MYVENPRKGMKNHGLSTNGMFLLYSDLYYVWKIGHSCTINVFFLKERPCFYLPILSTFHSLLYLSTSVLTLKYSCMFLL